MSSTVWGCPPSGNWHCPQALSGSTHHRVFMTARQDVVLIDAVQTVGTPPRPQIKILRCAPDKVKLLAVNVSSDGRRVGAAGEEGTIYWWSMEGAATALAGRVVRSHTDHQALAKQKCRVQSLGWSPVEPELLASADESGHVVVWDTRVNARRSIPLGKHVVAVLAWSPHHKDVLAVGCRHGLVLIVGLNGPGKILSKIRAHDEDIQSISWCPDMGNLFTHPGDSSHSDSLLAVGSKEKTISIWSKNTSKLVAKLILKPALAKAAKTNFYLTSLWAQPDVIVSAGSQGEVLKWDLKQATPDAHGVFQLQEVGFHTKVLHREHFRIVFSMTMSGTSLVSLGQDRQIVSFDLATEKLNYALPTMGGWVYDLALNPLDANVIAMATGDGLIRVWRSHSSKEAFDTTTLALKNSQTKVTTLAWHPRYDNFLAFGTDEGRIGTMDTQKVKNLPTFLTFKHRGQVYSLVWGTKPSSDQSEVDLESDKPVLYSCGDNMIMIHNTKNPNSPPVDLEKLIQSTNDLTRTPPNRSELIFHGDKGRFLALGSDDGSVEVFSMPEVKLLCVIKVHQKLIQCLRFHPMYLNECEEESSMSNCLAIASNESVIRIVDLKEPNNSSSIIATPTYSLTGHHSRVIAMAWSPHTEGMLVSVSYDTTVQIWDVRSEVGLANFSGHEGRLVTCLWSPSDPDVILSGGEDCSLLIWKISEQTEKMPVKKVDKPRIKREVVSHNSANSKEASPISGEVSSSNGGSAPETQISLGGGEKSKRTKKQKVVYFPHCLSDENRSRGKAGSDALKIAESTLSTLSGRDSLAFFDDDQAMEQLIEKESRAHLTENNLSAFSHMKLWTGDYREVLKQLISLGKLTDWHVSVALSCDYGLWQEACEAYARQLTHDDDHVKAASYLLLLNKVPEAIRTLAEAHLYREALALARVRLPKDSPLIQDLYRDWAKKSHHNGAYDLAGRAWAAAGEPLKAAGALAKLPEADNLRAGALFTRQADENDRAKVLAAQSLEAAKSQSNTGCMEKLLIEFPELAASQ
ncbi:hypothetical protein TCAL_05401 [Tigriopus californicus]|uniref:Uncharacterized protein n=1 Tax=Tigriopus californicus TaxID=6832 RepID=A0A553P1I9_TIGCA|nr:gem-associated protein 5-like [Tigriopus californicus]TRY71553.1 hypothetical protein TCAL_05401 [Tigriopus californicus]|eukprot:TCALIF_05401-PA protein Name:"Similar to GEMIN5 Gem-associated protein 5 (Homo sapiens)" AED:0.00 eAED:0.00 QI:130/1/0.5/1/1/1/2/0/1028